MSRLSDSAIDQLRRVAEWPDLPGERYQVIEPIGQGGMGTVYRARDRVLDRDVALKVLRPEVTGPEWANRLAREARILARLEHPGVVPVHDVGTLGDGRIYYLMKLVRGKRLDEFTSTASLSDTLRAFLRICDAVGFAHAHGVVHRDLKPSNVMVGAFGEVMVLDWGIARVTGTEDGPHGSPNSSASSAEGDTAPGTVLGTPGFMAPEQAQGAVHLVDERTDVFALGAILRSIVTLPATEAPQPLTAIWDRAMRPDPAARYSTVAELAADVTRFLDGQPVLSYKEPFFERVARLYTKYQTAILLILAYLTMRLLFLVLRGF